MPPNTAPAAIEPRTLVLLHGLASNSTRWWHFAAHTRLRAGWNLLRPDLRGHAGSSYRGRLDMGVWCDDLLALLDRQGSPRAVMMGHCLGANIALHFAARFPGRTAALVLVEPMPREALAGKMRLVRNLRPALLGLAVAARAFNAAGLRRRRLQAMNLEEWDRQTRAGREPIARYASILGDLRSTPAAAYLQGLAAVAEPLPALPEIRAPALVLLSRSAGLADPVRTRAAMQRLPGAEIVAIDAGHWIPTEQPEAMCAAVDAWLLRRAASTAIAHGPGAGDDA
jgi:pimeloyl-ACP methyl ester carboxylesterase